MIDTSLNISCVGVNSISVTDIFYISDALVIFRNDITLPMRRDENVTIFPAAEAVRIGVAGGDDVTGLGTAVVTVAI